MFAARPANPKSITIADTHPKAFGEDYGTPKAPCHPVPGKPGVFEREYTNAKVSIDCGSWKGSVTMADGRRVPMD